jgi:hypothetical protein
VLEIWWGIADSGCVSRGIKQVKKRRHDVSVCPLDDSLPHLPWGHLTETGEDLLHPSGSEVA